MAETALDKYVFTGYDVIQVKGSEEEEYSSSPLSESKPCTKEHRHLMAALKGFQEGNEEGSFGAGELNFAPQIRFKVQDAQRRTNGRFSRVFPLQNRILQEIHE